MLLPPASKGGSPPSLSDRCHAGTVANNLSSTFALEPTPSNLEQASRWAENAIHIARHALQDAQQHQRPDEATECGPCVAVGLFNSASLKEVGCLSHYTHTPAEFACLQMQGQKEAARARFQESLQFSRSIRFVEGAQQASLALAERFQ